MKEASEFGVSVLSYAGMVGDLASLGMLIKGGSDLDEPGVNGWTAMMAAADAGGFAGAKMLLDAGADPHVADKDGDNALLRAMGCQGQESRDLIDFVAASIAAKVDIDAVGSYGMTALMFSAENGFTRCAGLLLDAGCDIEVRDEDQSDAEELSQDEGMASLIKAERERRGLVKHVEGSAPPSPNGRRRM